MKRVQEYIDGLTFQTFKWDYKTVDAVIRNFEVIGEASKNVSPEIKIKYPNMPWEEMYRLRNRITHEYFGIDYEILWDIATNYLPQNCADLQLILDQESKQ
ncbi:MAG: DUF86 domain-containing protein [Bacteroidetes bacterium]|nr:DUF86 domain-containing protein [Bacteroidota bacterium]